MVEKVSGKRWKREQTTSDNRSATDSTRLSDHNPNSRLQISFFVVEPRRPCADLRAPRDRHRACLAFLKRKQRGRYPRHSSFLKFSYCAQKRRMLSCGIGGPSGNRLFGPQRIFIKL